MITVIIQFELPAGTLRDEVCEVFRQSVPKYLGRPGLIRKFYLINEAAGTAGAVYLWETRAAAEATYDDAWRRSFIDRYGADPTVTYFDTLAIIDNLTGEIMEEITGD